MLARSGRNRPNGHSFVNLHRLEAIGDAVFAFSLTLLALDLRIPAPGSGGLAAALVELEPKLLVFLFTFLIVAQEWDVHQRTMNHILKADGLFTWLNLISLMFVVLMPTSADILGKYPLQALALACFGGNTALLCLSSWLMWMHASRNRRLLDDSLPQSTVKMISRLWIFPPLVIAITLPLGLLSVYPVYAIWILMPIFSYSYSTWMARRGHIPANEKP